MIPTGVLFLFLVFLGSEVHAETKTQNLNLKTTPANDCSDSQSVSDWILESPSKLKSNEKPLNKTIEALLQEENERPNRKNKIVLMKFRGRGRGRRRTRAMKIAPEAEYKLDLINKFMKNAEVLFIAHYPNRTQCGMGTFSSYEETLADKMENIKQKDECFWSIESSLQVKSKQQLKYITPKCGCFNFSYYIAYKPEDETVIERPDPGAVEQYKRLSRTFCISEDMRGGVGGHKLKKKKKNKKKNRLRGILKKHGRKSESSHHNHHHSSSLSSSRKSRTRKDLASQTGNSDNLLYSNLSPYENQIPYGDVELYHPEIKNDDSENSMKHYGYFSSGGFVENAEDDEQGDDIEEDEEREQEGDSVNDEEEMEQGEESDESEESEEGEEDEEGEENEENELNDMEDEELQQESDGMNDDESEKNEAEEEKDVMEGQMIGENDEENEEFSEKVENQEVIDIGLGEKEDVEKSKEIEYINMEITNGSAKELDDKSKDDSNESENNVENEDEKEYKENENKNLEEEKDDSCESDESEEDSKEDEKEMQDKTEINKEVNKELENKAETNINKEANADKNKVETGSKQRMFDRISAIRENKRHHLRQRMRNNKRHNHSHITRELNKRRRILNQRPRPPLSSNRLRRASQVCCNHGIIRKKLILHNKLENIVGYSGTCEDVPNYLNLRIQHRFHVSPGFCISRFSQCCSTWSLIFTNTRLRAMKKSLEL